MTEILEATYGYSAPSTITHKGNDIGVTLSHHTELQEVNQIPCFFWGRLTEPYLIAKCLSTISKTVRSRFALTAQELAALRDPIVTAGKEQIRFEGFSSCNGVYARLDLLPQHLDGEFLASGTTNVDFNEPMINALNAVKKTENMVLSVGSKEVSISTSKGKQTEKKVSLPNRWIKGLTSVQHFLSEMSLKYELNKINVIQLFQSLPKSQVKGDLFIVNRANKFMFSPLQSANTVRVGSAHRLRLLEGLFPFIDTLKIYQSEDQQAVAFVITLAGLRLTMAFSADAYRGFSGEGKAIEHLITDIPLEWVYGLNSTLTPNELFQPSMLAIENDISFDSADSLTANLASIGMLGFDLLENQHFYRRLPFKTERIVSLNPRLKNAKKLISEDSIQLITNTPQLIEAQVKSSDGATHKVVINERSARCTCTWFTNNQGNKGMCKHILGVKMLTQV